MAKKKTGQTSRIPAGKKRVSVTVDEKIYTQIQKHLADIGYPKGYISAFINEALPILEVKLKQRVDPLFFMRKMKEKVLSGKQLDLFK